MDPRDDTFRREWARAEALLKIRERPGARRVDLPLGADRFKALGTAAWEWGKPLVRAEVFVFDDYATADTAERQLREGDHPQRGSRIDYTVNGGLLLRVTTSSSDELTRTELLSGFAGRE